MVKDKGVIITEAVMKLLTITVPCFNSEDYMEKCINSLLIGGEEVEILIVDDGSTDRTSGIADEYQNKYPEIIRAIHKENGGHGDAVNTGIMNATGKYFKVCDSDDWFDASAYKKVLKTLRELEEGGEEIDLLLANYVYDKVGRKKKKVMKYAGALPEKKIIGWNDDDIKFNKFQYVLMHSVIYRTKMLKESNLRLPKHTFYVDNIYVFKPMVNVKKLMYINADLYHYFIGREGQSVNEQTMIKRIDQQIFINKVLIDFFSNNKDIPKQMYKFLFQYMDMMMCVSSVMCIISKDKEKLEKKSQLWDYLRIKDKELYRQLRHTIFGIWMNLPGSFGRFLSRTGYQVMQKVFGFN